MAFSQAVGRLIGLPLTDAAKAPEKRLPLWKAAPGIVAGRLLYLSLISFVLDLFGPPTGSVVALLRTARTVVLLSLLGVMALYVGVHTLRVMIGLDPYPQRPPERKRLD